MTQGERVVRGTVTPLVVVLLVASGLLAAPVSAATGPAPGIGTATDGAVDGSGTAPTVTTPAPNELETAGNTTDLTDVTGSTATNDDGTTTNATDDVTSETVTASVDDGTATETVSASVDGGTTNDTVNASIDDGTTNDTVNASIDDGTTNDTVSASVDDATVNGSVSGTSLDAELATNGSSVTTSAAVNAGDTVAVSADAAVDAEGNLLASSATRTTDVGTSTPTGTAGENASADAGGAEGGGTDSGTDGDVPAAATGAALVGVGAAAVTLLVRRSATVVALLPDVVATASRFPSPLTQLWGSGRGWLSRRPSSLGQAWRTAREWLPRVLAAVGYSRYDDSDPLSHETRAELYDLIAASPGTYLSELSERADVPTSTVRHHLDVLVREGVVTTANVRGKRRYFSLDAGDETLAAALEDDASAAVIECLAKTGPASVSAIAEDLDRDVSTVSHHLGRLAEDGLVEREREGRSVYSDLTPAVEDALGSDGSGRQPRRA